MKFLNTSKHNKRSHGSNRLKCIRNYVGVQYLPYMFLFDLPSLESLVFKCPPQLVYPKKIFFYLKKKLLKIKGKSIFKSSRMSNYEKTMFIIRGFFMISQQKCQFENTGSTKFIKQFFSNQSYKNCFIQKTNSYFELFKLENENKIKNWIKLIKLIISLEKNKKIQEAKNLFQECLMRIRIPWTRNMLYGIKAFRDHLFNKYTKQDITVNRQQMNEQ